MPRSLLILSNGQLIFLREMHALSKKLQVLAERPGNLPESRRAELRRQAHNVGVAARSLGSKRW